MGAEASVSAPQTSGGTTQTSLSRSASTEISNWMLRRTQEAENRQMSPSSRR